MDRMLNFGRHIIKDYLIKSAPYNNVLDVGAGRGFDLSIAKEVNPSAKLHAIECFRDFHHLLADKGAIVQSADIEKEKFPYADCSMDVVMANQILEHTKEIFWIMHEISRVLTVGGKAIIGVPNLASLHNRILLAFGQQPTSIQAFSAHVRGFTKRDFLKFCDLCYPGGYELKAFKGSNFYPFPGWAAKPLAIAAPNMAWGIFFLLEKKRPYNGEFISYLKTNQLQTNFYQGGDN